MARGCTWAVLWLVVCLSQHFVVVSAEEEYNAEEDGCDQCLNECFKECDSCVEHQCPGDVEDCAACADLCDRASNECEHQCDDICEQGDMYGEEELSGCEACYDLLDSDEACAHICDQEEACFESQCTGLCESEHEVDEDACEACERSCFIEFEVPDEPHEQKPEL